jgi:CCR4-NOT transcription complex subunit 1
MAVDRAIVEIISPVVDRSVTIACMTTQELVLKDHALEPASEALRRSAHLMVTGLAQSLALVTAKEPLRIAVANNLRTLLTNQLDANTLEQVVAMLVADNLDLCCQVIEKAAGERAQREIDERLQGAYAARARAKAAGQPFADTSVMQGRFPGALPEALRPRPGQLTPQQQRVYEDFARIPRTAAAAAQSAGQPRPAGGLGSEGGAPGEPGAPGVPAADAEAAAAAQAAAGAAGLAPPGADLRSRFISWLQRMDLAISKDRQAQLSQLSDGSEVKVLVNEIAAIPTSEATALEVAKNIFAKVYQGAGSRLHVTAYCGALEVLRETAVRRLPVELTAWFTQLPEDGKFHKDVGEALLRAGLLYLPDLDIYLAKVLAGPRYQLAAEFALHLVQQCCVVEPVVSAAELAHTMELLSKLATRVSGGNAVLQLVEEARRVSLLRSGKPPPGAAAGVLPEGPKDPPQLVEAIMKLFDRWARLLEEAPQEKVHAPFVTELQAAGFLKGDEMTERFLRIMIQLAVQHCLRSEAAAAASMPPGAPRPAPLSFIAVDAAVRLFVCLITQHGGGNSLFVKVLGILASVLQRDVDERGGAFNGRPYYRMCVGFLAELSPADPADEAGLQHLQVG